MKATIEVELQPFSVPNFAQGSLRKPETEGASYPLSELDSCTLDKLCREFRDEVFRKAGKEPPPEQAPICDKCGEAV